MPWEKGVAANFCSHVSNPSLQNTKKKIANLIKAYIYIYALHRHTQDHLNIQKHLLLHTNSWCYFVHGSADVETLNTLKCINISNTTAVTAIQLEKRCVSSHHMLSHVCKRISPNPGSVSGHHVHLWVKIPHGVI